MKRASVMVLILFLTGCATGLTEAGRKIRVIHDVDPVAFTECVRLGLVTGETGTILSGGDYGVFYATTDARNKAALIPEADTLLLTDNHGRRLGGEVTGIAYNCNPQGMKPVPKTYPSPAPRDDVFEKVKKCRSKGGVWINNQCVIQIE
jgi:hypothetical protein